MEKEEKVKISFRVTLKELELIIRMLGLTADQKVSHAIRIFLLKPRRRKSPPIPKGFLIVGGVLDTLRFAQSGIRDEKVTMDDVYELIEKLCQDILKQTKL